MKSTSTRSIFGMVLAALVVWLAPRSSDAQLAPTGGHYAARPSDTGFDGGGPNAMGGYSTSIPLSFPPARGGLPIPMEVVYSGHGFGAAGLDWDIPLSYVQVDNSFSHRRPASTSVDTVPQPRQRIV